MSSAERAASSSGCVARPRGRETGLTGYAEQIQRSLPTGSSAMETAEHREPYEPRGSRTDLGAPGGESPPGDPTTAVDFTVECEWLERVESGQSKRCENPRISQQILTNSPARELRLQLAFDLVEKAPVGAVGDDLLGGRFDQSGFAQAKSVPADRVLRIELPPLVIVVRQRLSGIVGSRNATSGGEAPGGPRGVCGAQIRRLQNRAQHRTRRVRVGPDVIRKTSQHTAEILRPWPVNGGIDEHMTDVLGAQLLRLKAAIDRHQQIAP